MSAITTFSGKHFDPSDPLEELFDVKDIAHALSYLCRGNGHVHQFFSVGEHSIWCFREAKARGYSIRLQLACLLHDASEAYMADVPRPFKEKLTDYVKSEERLLSMLYRHFLGSDLTEEEKILVKTIDDELLWYDLVYLLREKPLKEKPKLYTELPYGKLSFSEVENTFLDIYCRLKEKL